MTPLCSNHAFDKCRARLLCLWDSPSKNTGVGCHFFLQGIFPMQGSKPHLQCLPHLQADSLPLCHLGSPNVEKVNKYFAG